MRAIATDEINGGHRMQNPKGRTRRAARGARFSLGSVREALELLEHRDRVKLRFVIALQSSLSLLDLAAVSLLGVVALLTVGAASNSTPPQIASLIDLTGLEHVPVANLAVTLAALAGILMISKSALSFYVTYRTYRFLASRQAAISSALGSRVLARPLLEVQSRASQDTAYALTYGVNSLTMGVIGSFSLAIAEVALLFVLAIGLLLINPIVTLFTIAFFGLVALLLVKVLGSRAKTIGGRNASAQVASIQSIQELLGSYREVTVAGRRAAYLEQFQGLRWEFASIQASAFVLSQVGKYVLEIALVVGAALLAFSQLLTDDLVAATATLAVFLGAGSRIMPSMLRLQAALLGIRSHSGIAEPTLKLAQELDAAECKAGAPSTALDAVTTERLRQGLDGGFDDFAGAVCIQDVTVTYPGADRPALKGIGLEIPAGSSLALVGPTGAGKSTLSDIILGIIQPDQGNVSICGLSPQQAIARWPGALAYVAQETALANADVRANVALGLPDGLIDDDRVWEALSKARLSGFLGQQPDGLRTKVGEDGVRLSGGQRQRLGLARALYTNPKLIVLDEATSALDAETEGAITTTLHELHGKVTLIIVAHRLATVRDLDKAAYLEGGQMLAFGEFCEVRQAVPAFDRQAKLLGL